MEGIKEAIGKVFGVQPDNNDEDINIPLKVRGVRACLWAMCAAVMLWWHAVPWSSPRSVALSPVLQAGHPRRQPGPPPIPAQSVLVSLHIYFPLAILSAVTMALKYTRFFSWACDLTMLSLSLWSSPRKIQRLPLCFILCSSYAQSKCVNTCHWFVHALPHSQSTCWYSNDCLSSDLHSVVWSLRGA